ncbi:MAG: hypothetical protein ACTHXS_07230, partial [Flaviflexus sp.]
MWILLGIFLILAATVGVLFGLGVIGSDDAELPVELTDREGTYGSDSELDALWDACADGDLAACDELYENAAEDSEYRTFGSTCGETETESHGDCATNAVPRAYGDDPELDALWDACADGDLAACDELYENAVDDSAYRVFGNTCGETSAAQSGGCEEELYADAQEPSPSATVEPAPEPSPTPAPEPSPTPAP